MAEVDRMLRAELGGLSEMPSEMDPWRSETTLPDTPHHLSRHLPSLFESAPLDTFGYSPSNPDLDSLLSSFGDISVGSIHCDNVEAPLADPSGQWASQGVLPTRILRGGDVDGDLGPLNIPLGMHSGSLHAPPDPPRTVHMSDVTLGGATISGESPLTAATMGTGPPSPLPPRTRKRMEHPEDNDQSDLELSYPSESNYSPPPVGTSLPDIRPSRRKARVMTKVPVPIPNLTKKSRGRKVPTSSGDYAPNKDNTKKGKRTYTCHAHGCGKCFVRGEHLKRHIRSIHTNEKPWKCTHAGCSRTFSRRDNLNQHLRIHPLQM
ncbi:hypothetical protein PAXRUDRAFT_833407 [Paxillus rubicundulus Ve08.2h10]|uniref:Unplaced genomic scaffold scaffold_1147, whole genome shotgun sequence n=1 Tax=Paxillus rubicundulus Ve08.2h10 TaxID=930991 RepID=A0A0D0D9W9_9AGAM|nr:hypothetical protein PAXRUDRAFT_833407 [Paxillus rubicundulus Ve08.2h10]